MSLHELKAGAEDARKGFLRDCAQEGFETEWEAYCSEHSWSERLLASHRTWISRLHAYYTARDGASGFLGGKGL